MSAPSPWPLHRRVSKRALDVSVAAFGLVLCALPFVLLGAWVRLSSPGPALFGQLRVGRGGRLFRMWKFRTMNQDAALLGLPLTAAGDPRVTPLGRFLRRAKLDELPQLVNVLLGDMSLVGPRPEVPRYVAAYTPEDHALFAVRPGITDPASIEFRDEESTLAHYEDPERAYLEIVLPYKLALGRAYLKEQSFFGDLTLLVRTLAVL
jgi:lipopolysaccharide/colanic/teichoic acid biosynthesis glycosyltransferase